MTQHNVTVTFTAEQARILLTMIRNDTEAMKRSDCDRKFILQNDRMEERLIKAMFKANGMKGF